jgi:hypothetical protein
MDRKEKITPYQLKSFALGFVVTALMLVAFF